MPLGFEATQTSTLGAGGPPGRHRDSCQNNLLRGVGVQFLALSHLLARKLFNGLALLNSALTSGFARWAYRSGRPLRAENAP